MAEDSELPAYLGHHGIERVGPEESEPPVEIPEHYFRIQFAIDGKVFDSSVEWLLNLERGAHGEVSEVDLEIKLARCSYHAFTFLVAKQELALLKRRKDREFRGWIAAENARARATIFAERKAMKLTGTPSGWMGSITKGDVEEKILSDPTLSIILEKKQSEIDEITKHEEITEGLVKIILEHSSNLRAILFKKASKRSGDYVG